MITANTRSVALGLPQENGDVLFARFESSTTPNFLVADLPVCQICGEKVTSFYLGCCMHVMHEACEHKGACRACYPKIETQVLGTALNVFGGANGAGFLLTHNFQEAILNALCPGVYFLNRIVFGSLTKFALSKVKKYVSADDVDSAVFVISCNMMYPPEFAVFSMWVVGAYYWDAPKFLNRFKFFVEMSTLGAMLTAYEALQYNENVGILVVSAMCWVQMWRWPNIWDMHCGNCFLLLPILLYVMLCLAAAVFINETFFKYPFIQVYVIARLFFSHRSVKHIVSPHSAYVIVITGLQIIVAILLTKIFYLSAVIKQMLDSQQNELQAPSQTR